MPQLLHNHPLLQHYQKYKTNKINQSTHKELHKIYDFTNKYSLSILDEKAINEIVKYSPLIELGAGMGYNAKLLSRAGANIIAYDKVIWEKPLKNKQIYHPIIKGDCSKLGIKKNIGRNLIISWPPSDNEMGYECLKEFTGQKTKTDQGQYFIFIGDYRITYNAIHKYTTGTTKFFDYLDKNFNLQKTLKLPTWNIIKDTKLYIYCKK
jgi:hypothetical protein